MMRVARPVVRVAAVAMYLAIAPAAQAVYPGANGQLSYEIVGLVPGPEWSPDGTKKAYEEYSGSVVKTNADGSGRTVVYDLAAHGYSGTHGLSWSADATELVLAPFTGSGKSDLVVVSADGSGQRSLTNTPTVSEAFPEWSPDGSKIAFARESQIATISPDGAGLALLPTQLASNPSWAPDQSRVAYQEFACRPSDPDECRYQLAVINADGSGRTLFLPPDVPGNFWSTNYSPIWSPDGKKIGFTSDRDGIFDVYLMNPDGTNQTHYAGDETFDYETSDWQPIPIKYVRPKSASPVIAQLVPAYEECTAPNRTHGPPLGFGSCAPPTQTSAYLTLGTPDANGVPAKGLGYVRYDALAGNPTTPVDEADVALAVTLSDVRNKSDLTDYTGELSADAALRITDKDNSPYPGGPGPGTVADTSFPVSVPCAATASNSIGSTCQVATTADSLVPGAVDEGRRGVWELGQVKVYDGGADRTAATTADNTLFMRQGVFVP
jgi:hypothetical protein